MTRRDPAGGSQKGSASASRAPGNHSGASVGEAKCDEHNKGKAMDALPSVPVDFIMGVICALLGEFDSGSQTGSLLAFWGLQVPIETVVFCFLMNHIHLVKSGLSGESLN